MVETPEEKERSEIRAESLALLSAGKYDTLDALARTHRASKECYADGVWKLKEVYAGLVPAETNSETQWQAGLTAIREWIKAKPESITARVALADTLVSYAWKARGSGYANTVTENGWKLFEQRVMESAQVLKDSKALKETCPRWWSVMLTIAMASGVDKPRYQTVFAEARKAEPANEGYYFQMAYYLLPRWHGNPNDTARFLQEAADQIGGDDGDLLYARRGWVSKATYSTTATSPGSERIAAFK